MQSAISFGNWYSRTFRDVPEPAAAYFCSPAVAQLSLAEGRFFKERGSSRNGPACDEDVPTGPRGFTLTEACPH
jgi:hypothetical protein